METKTENQVKILGRYNLNWLMNDVLIASGVPIPNVEWNAKILLLNMLLSNKTEHSKKEISELIQNILESMPSEYNNDTLLAMQDLPFDENYGFNNNELNKFFADFLYMYAKKIGCYGFIKNYSLFVGILNDLNKFNFFRFINNKFDLAIIFDVQMEKEVKVLCGEARKSDDFEVWYQASLFINKERDMFIINEQENFLKIFHRICSNVTHNTINDIYKAHRNMSILSKYYSLLKNDFLKKGVFIDITARNEFIHSIIQLKNDVVRFLDLDANTGLEELYYYRKQFLKIESGTKFTKLIISKINERILEILRNKD